MGVTNYYTVNGEIIAQDTDGTRTDFLTDALGSITATKNQSQQIVNTYRYKPYGARLSKTGMGADPKFQWRGDDAFRKSPTSDLLINGSTTYDCNSGRITTSNENVQGSYLSILNPLSAPGCNLSNYGRLIPKYHTIREDPMPKMCHGWTPWRIKFNLQHFRSRSGWIIQRIRNYYPRDVMRCDGRPANDCLFPAHIYPRQSQFFYEYWYVENGKIYTGSNFLDSTNSPSHDVWTSHETQRCLCTKSAVTVTASIAFHEGVPKKCWERQHWNLRSGHELNVDAGDLLASVERPTGWPGKSGPIWERTLSNMWNCCKPNCPECEDKKGSLKWGPKTL